MSLRLALYLIGFCLSLFTFSRTFQNLVEGVNETTNLYDIKCQWTRLTRESNPRAFVFFKNA